MQRILYFVQFEGDYIFEKCTRNKEEILYRSNNKTNSECHYFVLLYFFHFDVNVSKEQIRNCSSL